MSSSSNKAAQEQQNTVQQQAPIMQMAQQGMDQRQFMGLLEEIKRKQAMQDQMGTGQSGGLLQGGQGQQDSGGAFGGWRSWLG